jgi:hypothetical protein
MSSGSGEKFNFENKIPSMNIRSVSKAIPPKGSLWRYFDFQKFLSFAIDKSLFFTRMDRMEDLNEGISSSQLRKKYGGEVERTFTEIFDLESKKKELDLKKRQEKYFISCWLIHHRESVAMWNSYSDTNGIALRVNAASLISSVTKQAKNINDVEKISSLYYGQISYKDFLSAKGRYNFKDETRIIGFHKDLCFDHEKEFRFLYKQNLYRHLDDNIPFLKLKLKDFNKIKFDLVFHPKMENWKKDNIKTVLKALKVKNIKPIDSELKLKSW